jgi:NTE family protein
MNVIVVFGGGGALGAFDCGVWNVLAPVLRDRGATLVGVGGASIGAINAACLARHGRDLRAGAAALESLWCDQLVTPSFPFAGMFGDRDQHRWNGVLTGLLFGNRQLYRSHSPHWNPLAGLDRRAQPLMDRSAMRQWLDTHIGTIRTGPLDDPLLCVPAVDVQSGGLVLFDSARAPVTGEHLAAASALPLLFEPVMIDGRLYWDGDMTRESMLPHMLDRLRQCGRLAADTGEQTVLVTVDHMPRASSHTPCSGLELVHRALELLLHGKMAAPAGSLGGITHVIEIVREPIGHDAISGQFDYSPERIRELVDQGQSAAERAWLGRWIEVEAAVDAGATQARHGLHAAAAARAAPPVH